MQTSQAATLLRGDCVRFRMKASKQPSRALQERVAGSGIYSGNGRLKAGGQSRRPFARPERGNGVIRSDTCMLGHSTVLINFFGVTILTDPVLFARVGIRLPGITSVEND